MNLNFIIIIVLTLINAFFAASEMAMVSCDKIKLYKKSEAGDKNAKLLLKVLKEPSRFLSTIQVGITLAGFFSSASAATSISKNVGEFLNHKGIPFGESISFFVITIALSYIMLVFGELVPKRIALQYSEKFSLMVIKPISIVEKFLRPFVSLLSISTNSILRIAGIKIENVEEKITLEEIGSLVNVGHEQGFINPIEKEFISSVISFDDKKAEEIMTARTEVFSINAGSNISEYIVELLNLKYSRVPVYEKDIDNIIGILYLKDFLLKAYTNGFENIKIKKILRPAYFVPSKKNISDLFLELKYHKNHMAVLIDEYGGFTGIVTMEDLIEEIVGDIDDEYDSDEPDIINIENQKYIINGSTSIKEVNSKVGLSIDSSSDDYDTIGGYIIHNLGYIPKEDDLKSIDVDNKKIIIKKIKDNKIEKILIQNK